MLSISFFLCMGFLSFLSFKLGSLCYDIVHHCLERRSAGCSKPVRTHRLPLGLDILAQSFQANREHRYMEYLLGQFRRFGNTFQQTVGLDSTIFTIEPANLQAILSTNAQDWDIGMRRAIFLPLFGDGLFTQDGEAWKHSRNNLRPHFSHRLYDDLAVFRHHVDNLLEAASGAGSVVDLQPLFLHLTLDVGSQFFFGESLDSQRSASSPVGKRFETALDFAQTVCIRQLGFRRLRWLVGGRAFRDACNTVHAFAKDVIERRLSYDPGYYQGGKQQQSFLEAVAASYPDPVALRGQVTNLLIAGRDSTAALLTWTFFHLARNPAVLHRLREEIETMGTSDEDLRRADLFKLGYLQNVLREVLRLHPPVSFISRTAARDTILPVGGGGGGGGPGPGPAQTAEPVRVAGGTSVLYSAYALHRRPDLYGADAELFRPARWDDDERLRSPRSGAGAGAGAGPAAAALPHLAFVFMPFGAGPRSCLGMDFALTEASYTVVRLLRHFPSLGLPPGERADRCGQEEQTVMIVLRPTHGCRVQLGQRGK
ncbi:cytochrome P450 alkane hydroxylase [Xylariaceae sp. FL0804]|nr:cytochrome P450 alkane hydroxylase [Xylariaceae sp. FL0804]